jgi:hypothetical protein
MSLFIETYYHNKQQNSLLLRSVGHRVKTHRITPAPGNEGLTSRSRIVSYSHTEKMIVSPRPLVMDVTMTRDRYGRSTQRTNGALTHRASSTGAPQSDGVLNNADRMKIRHYRQIYADRSDPIVFLPVAVSTSFAFMMTLHLIFTSPLLKQ